MAEQVSIVAYPAPSQPESARVVSDVMAEVLVADAHVVVDAFGEARAWLEAGGVAATELAPFARAEQLLAEGWRSYLEVRASFAASRLSEARTLALRVAHLEGGTELLAEISLRLGVVKLDLQRTAEAADDFRLARSLAPSRTVSDAEFKPEVVEAYEAALGDLREPQVRQLELSPSNAAVLVDAAASDGEQLLMADGLHLLSVHAPGYYSHSELVSVSPGVEAAIRVKLEANPMAQLVIAGGSSLQQGTPESVARQAVTAALLYSGGDSMVLVASVWRRGEPALLGQYCSGLPAQCSAVIETGYPEGGLRVAIQELWRRLRVDSLRFPPTVQVDARLVESEGTPGKGRKVEPQPLWKNRWVWLGVGAAALAGSAVYLLRGDQRLEPIFEGDRCGFGGCL